MAHYLTNQSAGVGETQPIRTRGVRLLPNHNTRQIELNLSADRGISLQYNTTVDINTSSLSSEMRLHASTAQMQYYCRALVCLYTETVLDEARTTLQAERYSQPPNQSG